uniref:Helicase C-terminal domain-containing protein n=1 Tax=Gibberella zeae TaxID=5518 RepID=A0A4E9ENZ6_GIBZA
MQGHPLDNFIFTVGSTNRQGHSRLHTLSEFLTLPDSIVTRHQDAKPIPIGRRYTFGRLRDAVKEELGDAGKGFEFIVPNAAQGEARFKVHDQASLSRTGGQKPEPGKAHGHTCSSKSEAQGGPTTGIYIPETTEPDGPPWVHTTTPREDRGKAAAEAVIATEDDDEDTDGILGFLRRKNLIKGDKVRALAWTFNIDNADTMDMDTTWKVPGMLSEATISQCGFVYELGLRLREETSMQGIYNADGVGCGKTFTTFMLLVLRRLASLTSQHLKEHPDEHIWSVENGGRCAFTQSIGIQCVCEKNSILEVLLDRLPNSYSVVTAPIAVASVWEDHYIDFIEPVFTGANFPFRGEPVLHAYNWHDKTSLRPLGQSPHLSLASFMVEPILPRMSKSNARRVHKDAPARSRWTVDELGEALENGPNATQVSFRPHHAFTPQHSMSLIIVGRERLSLYASSTGTPDSDVVECWVKTAGKPARAVEVAKCFLLDPSVIICDEAQEYKGKDSKIAKALLGLWQRKERLQQAAPFAVFLSATPAIKDLSDLEMASSIINRQQGRHAKVMAALRLADRHSNERNSPSYIDAIRAACRAVDMWMISRAGYSPMLDQGCRISALHPPPETIAKAFDTPQELRRALGETIDKVRGGMVEHNVRVDPAAFEHVMMSVKGADLMLKAGSVPGLQACVTADSNFPYSMGRVEEDIQAYNDMRRRRDSAYFQKLDLLTRNDPMFVAMANIVSQASQGKVASKPHHQVSSSPLHVILFTQHPCNAAAAYIYLRENCGRRADVVCLLSDTKPAARAEKLGELRRSSQGRRVDKGDKSIIVITTFRLGGFGLNDFVFCNLMIQLGEPQTQAGLIQAIGRVARRGQTKKTFRFYLKREGSESEELLRIRNERRTGVCHEQLGQMRLFQGLTLH